jgi:hypothetical protein
MPKIYVPGTAHRTADAVVIGGGIVRGHCERTANLLKAARLVFDARQPECPNRLSAIFGFQIVFLEQCRSIMTLKLS